MTVQEQIPSIDAKLARIDRRIASCKGKLINLENKRITIESQIERQKRYLQELGRLRSERATFRLL